MIQKVIEQYDRQIKKEFNIQLSYAISEQRLNTYGIMKWKKDLNNLKLCESHISKQIFLKSINFTAKDWKKLRDESYYNELFLETGINKKLYKLAKIEQYINNTR